MTQTTAERPAEGRSGPVRRYVIRRLSGPLHWGIFDRHMGAWCSLAIGRGLFEPLEWKTAEEAQVWLYLCRVAWGNGLVEPPAGWN